MWWFRLAQTMTHAGDKDTCRSALSKLDTSLVVRSLGRIRGYDPRDTVPQSALFPFRQCKVRGNVRGREDVLDLLCQKGQVSASRVDQSDRGGATERSVSNTELPVTVKRTHVLDDSMQDVVRWEEGFRILRHLSGACDGIIEHRRLHH